MKTWIKKYFNFILVLLMTVTLSGCEAIGDIFSAGFYMGMFVVVLVIAVIVWLITRMGRNK